MTSRQAPSPETNKTERHISRFLVPALAVLGGVVLILVNVLVFRYAGRIIDDVRLHRVILHHLNPTFWPSWGSYFLWTLAIGCITDFFVRQPFFQQWLHGVRRLLEQCRPSFLLPLFGRLQSSAADWPLERRLIALFSNTIRLLKRFASPVLLVRSLTVLTCSGIVLIQSDWGMFLLNRTIETIFFVPRLPTWAFLRFYYEPLCEWFCYGTLPWQLPVAVMSVCVLAAHTYRKVQRIARSPRRKKATQHLIHYLIVTATLLAALALVSVIPTLISVAIRMCNVILAVPFLPLFLWDQYHVALCNLFSYGIPSWWLPVIGLPVCGLMYALYRTSAVAAQSAYRTAITTGIVRGLGVVSVIVTIILLAWYLPPIILWIGRAMMSVVFVFFSIPSFFSWFVFHCYFLPLCNLLCYGSIPWRLLITIPCAVLLCRGILEGGRLLCRSAYREVVTRWVVRGGFITFAGLLLVPVVYYVIAFSVALPGTIASFGIFSESFFRRLYVEPLIPFFCYGYVSWKLFISIPTVVLLSLGIYRIGQTIARSRYQQPITTGLKKCLAILVMGMSIVIFLRHFGMIASVVTAFGNTVFALGRLLFFVPEHGYYLPLVSLFCYGTVPWPLLLTIPSILLASFGIYRGGTMLARSSYRPQVSSALILFTGLVVTVTAIVFLIRYAGSLASLVATVFTTVVNLPGNLFVDFYVHPLYTVFCHGALSWKLLFPTTMAAVAVWCVYRGGKVLSRLYDKPLGRLHYRDYISVPLLVRGLVVIGVFSTLIVCLRHIAWFETVIPYTGRYCFSAMCAFAAMPRALFAQFYEVPLYDLFCYWTVSWKLLAFVTISILLAWTIRQSAVRLARTNQRRVNQTIGIAAICFIAGIPIVFPPFLNVVTANILTVFMATYQFPELFFTSFYRIPLRDLFCYGIVSWKLFVVVAIAAMGSFAIFRGGHALAASKYRSKTTRLFRLIFAALAGLILTVLFIRHIDSLGTAFVGIMSTLRDIPTYFVTEFYSIPLQTLFSHGIISWRLLAFITVAAAIAWSFYKGGDRLARSRYAIGITAAMDRSMRLVLISGGCVAVVWLGLIALQPIFHHLCRLGVLSSFHAFQQQLMYDPFCDLFCYGTFSSMFLLTCFGLIVTMYGIYRAGRFLSRSAIRTQVTRVLIGTLSVVAIGGGVAASVAYGPKLADKAIGSAASLGNYYAETLPISFCNLFCYGKVSWGLTLIVCLPLATSVIVHRFGKRLSQSLYRDKVTTTLVRVFAIGIPSVTALFVFVKWKMLLDTVHAAWNAFLSGKERFFDLPLHIMFCYGQAPWELITVVCLVVASGAVIYKSAHVVARNAYRERIERFIRWTLIACAPILMASIIFCYRLSFAETSATAPIWLVRIATAFYFLPLYEFFCYDIISWKIISTLGFVSLCMWSVHRGEKLLSQSRYRCLFTKILVGCSALIAVVLTLFFVYRFGSSLLPLPEHLMTKFCYLPFCNLFAYGMVSWQLLVALVATGTLASIFFIVARSIAVAVERTILKKTAFVVFGTVTVLIVGLTHLSALAPIFGSAGTSLAIAFTTAVELPYQEYIGPGTISWPLLLVLSFECLLLWILCQLWINVSKAANHGNDRSLNTSNP